ncbi:hypothetical protein MMC08_005116 [Hypocenomyce scalaris]|nr:hypothetical protein [Hypocenomyce scalaris]
MRYESGQRQIKIVAILEYPPRTFRNTDTLGLRPSWPNCVGAPLWKRFGVADADKDFVESLLPIVQKHWKGFGQYGTLFEGPHTEAHLLRIAHRMASLVMAYAFDLEKETVEADADEEGFLSDDE